MPKKHSNKSPKKDNTLLLTDPVWVPKEILEALKDDKFETFDLLVYLTMQKLTDDLLEDVAYYMGEPTSKVRDSYLKILKLNIPPHNEE